MSLTLNGGGEKEDLYLNEMQKKILGITSQVLGKEGDLNNDMETDRVEYLDSFFNNQANPNSGKPPNVPMLDLENLKHYQMLEMYKSMEEEQNLMKSKASSQT